MATVVFVDVAGNLYSFRWFELESGFNTFLSVLEIDISHGALCCTVRQSTVQHTYTNKDLICAATPPPYEPHTHVF